MTKIKEYQPDEVAMLFPLMEGAPYEQMKADVADRGFVEKGTVFRGKLLDGRNRQRIAVELGIEFPVVEYAGDPSPIALFEFVVSKNLHRRHLNESQRAMLAAKSKPLLERLRAENRERIKHGAKKGAAVKPGEAFPQGEEKRDATTNTREQLGKIFNVSGHLVSDAVTIDESDSEAADTILAGEKTVTEVKRERQSKEKEAAQTASRRHQAAIVASKPPPEVLKEKIRFAVALVDASWYRGPNDAGWLEISNTPVVNHLAEDAIVFIRTGGSKTAVTKAEAILAKWELSLIDDQLLLKGAVDKPGKWFKRTVEEIVIGVRGSPEWPAQKPDGLVNCPPGKVHALIESLTPAYDNLRLELGAQKIRKGWVCWPTGKEPVAA